MSPQRRARRAARRGGCAAVALLLLAAGPLAAQSEIPADRRDLPRWADGSFDGPYPVRILTMETARMLDEGEAIAGLGDARYPLPWWRAELVTNTISDIAGVANLGLKVGLLEPAGSRPAIVVGVKYYQSYPGLINKGVARIAESFSNVTDSEVDVSGWVGYASASWIAGEGATGLHLGLQGHMPSEARFEVADSVNGGGGFLAFDEGEDVSVMWGVDHRLIGSRLVALLEAGWSFGLERPRFGAGFDAGSQRWRVALGVTYPGIVTDVATEPRDLVMTPVLSIHHRF